MRRISIAVLAASVPFVLVACSFLVDTTDLYGGNGPSRAGNAVSDTDGGDMDAGGPDAADAANAADGADARGSDGAPDAFDGGSYASCEASGGLGVSNCGPNGGENCCESPLVTGGMFLRSYDNVTYVDAGSPASVSNFRLDRFEVTVGRFRRFVAAVLGGWKPATGSGKHAHLNGGKGLATEVQDAYEGGWDVTWTGYLPTTLAEWTTNLSCGVPDQTWTETPGANDSLPLSCENWYEAYAFCIWDGGFLPSEAEWNYAAAGGSEQRVYPWSSPSTTTTIDCSNANYNGTCSAAGVNRGGSAPKGDGKWGQADLAGNLWEWNLDFTGSYPTPCSDCASLGTPANRVLRGGSYVSNGSLVLAAHRHEFAPSDRDGIAIRCARSP